MQEERARRSYVWSVLGYLGEELLKEKNVDDTAILFTGKFKLEHRTLCCSVLTKFDTFIHLVVKPYLILISNLMTSDISLMSKKLILDDITLHLKSRLSGTLG